MRSRDQQVSSKKAWGAPELCLREGSLFMQLDYCVPVSAVVSGE